MKHAPFVTFVAVIVVLYTTNVTMLAHAWDVIQPWFDLGIRM